MISGGNTLIIHLNRATPLSSYAGFEAGTKSLGKILQNPHINIDDVYKNMIMTSNKRIGILCYNALETDSYPEITAGQLTQLLKVCRTEIEDVILVLAGEWIPADMKKAVMSQNGVIIALLTTDVKGLVWQRQVLSGIEHIAVLSKAEKSAYADLLKTESGAQYIIDHDRAFRRQFKTDGKLPAKPSKSCQTAAKLIADKLTEAVENAEQ